MTRANTTRRRRGGRHAKGRHGLFFSLLWTLICLGLLGGGAYAVFEYVQSSDDFKVQFVEVFGNQALSKQKILEQSGITTDDGVFALSLDLAAARVEALPYVKSCTVSVKFPDTVIIEVEERQPFVSLIVNNRTYAIDREAVPLEEYSRNETPIEPYITNVAGVDFVELGEPIESLSLHTALDVWEEFSRVHVDLTVSEIEADSETNICMVVEEFGYVIRWARGDIGGQALRLAVFLDAKSRGAGCSKYIDLRFGENIVCK